jgi:hypothetical protein
VPLRPSLRVLLASAALAVAILVPSGGAVAGSSCKNLKVTDGLKADLHDAHARLTDRPFTGPKGRVYYGRCETRYYALASFKDADLGYTDQPEQFTRRAGHPWKDRGDTGGPPCDTRVPRALLKLWGFDC